MQLFFDFLPLLAFFAAYKLGGMYAATGALMVAMVLLCGLTWLRQRKVGNMMLISTVLALVLGGITLLVRDKAFIQWKLTILDWLFAAGFLLAPRFLGGQTIVQKMMGAQLTLPEHQWRTLNWMWIGFFILVGALNVYVMRNFDEATWVNFKMFGTTGLTLAFVVVQGIWLAGKLPKDAADKSADAATARRDADQPPTDPHN